MPVERAAGGTSLIDVLDRVLDKGIVIDAWVRVSLVGIALITVEARVVVASIDTYLKYSEAVAQVAPISRPADVLRIASRRTRRTTGRGSPDSLPASISSPSRARLTTSSNRRRLSSSSHSASSRISIAARARAARIGTPSSRASSSSTRWRTRLRGFSRS